jgi:hypothetical protein
MEVFISCGTNPALRGPKTDHVPILSIQLTIPRTKQEHIRNFRETDWSKFKEVLTARLNSRPASAHIYTNEAFQSAAHNLALSLDETISETVPISEPNPHSKHWWTHDLTLRQRQVNKAAHTAYKMRALPLHTCHSEFKRLHNHYAEEIFKSKKQHWTDWLEEISGNEIWIANKYITSAPTDDSKTRIPTLSIRQNDNTTREATSNAEKSTALAESFFPQCPTSSSVPTDFTYPDPIASMVPITPDEIHRNINKLSPFKAPGPDGICNVVFKQCASLLVPFLLPLFNASINLHTYYQPWCQFTTVVLCKPGKPDYTVTKVYRPIALLNTTCKLLTTVIADQMTYYLEHHQLLPATHFGGRPGRSTTDSLHLLEETIKNTWRTKKVASVLFLDIEGAFPNAVTDQLLHNMKVRRLPRAMIDFTEQVLMGRQTRLQFDNFKSDWFPVTNGISQGDPLLMILYIIYNADLVDVAKNHSKSKSTLAFVDDTAFIAVGSSFQEMHRILSNMLNRPGGGYEWSNAHNSNFETSKFALIDFSMNRTKTRPPMIIRGNTIHPSATHKFLGVILDQELRWKDHIAYAIAKGTAYTLQLHRLSSTASGMPMKLTRQLYQAVAIP